MEGYHSRAYAESFEEWGQPFELKFAGGWVLERLIPGTSCLDLMNYYPLFVCQNPSGLAQDIDALEKAKQHISLLLVTDPYMKDVKKLAPLFPELFKPFKKHYYIDLSQPKTISKHHKYYAQKALKLVDIQLLSEPIRYIDDWQFLYQFLIQRHHLFGIKAFSQKAFKKQFQVPGLRVFVAKYASQIVAMHLWYVDNARRMVYSHLISSNDVGYEFMASYALYSEALDYFSTLGFRYIHLGSGLALMNQNEDGLGFFKRGWSNQMAINYLCGRVLQPEAYQLLSQQKSTSGYFPAYRSGEF